MTENLNYELTRRQFLQYAASAGLSASALALLNGCGIFPAPTPTPARIPRIGYLSTGSPTSAASLLEAFRQGLRDLGYVEGRNIVIEYRFTDGNDDLLPVFASELVALNVDILVAGNTAGSLAAKNATSTIPILFLAVGDPVGSGLVESIAHPGGNVTGLTFLVGRDLSGKRLQLLQETIPRISRMGVLWNPTNPNRTLRREIEDSGAQLGLQLQWLEWRGPDDFEGAFASATNGHAEALYIEDPVNLYRARIIELAAKSRLPTMWTFPNYAREGGLMAYGVNGPDLFRRGATYVDKILKGRKPADLPVEQPIKFEFVINLKTAKELGLMIPQSILAQATEVIQ